jgi:hypothetical protein
VANYLKANDAEQSLFSKLPGVNWTLWPTPHMQVVIAAQANLPFNNKK